MNPVDVTISSFTYFILPNINDDLIYKKSMVTEWTRNNDTVLFLRNNDLDQSFLSVTIFYRFLITKSTIPSSTKVLKLVIECYLVKS